MKTLGPVGHFLSDESKWTKDALAVDKHGNRVLPSDLSACKWCLWGAIVRVIPDNGDLVASFKMAWSGAGISDNYELARWNDAPHRTFDDVRKLLEETGI